MRFDKTKVWGFEHSLNGMRNPMNSWDKTDSLYGYNHCATCDHSYLCDKCISSDPHDYAVEAPVIGNNDMKLAQQLIRAGSEHRKFLRQIFVSVDITAPLYWYKEFDTYKIGTAANSTSTMHKLSTTPITLECFEIDDIDLDLECLGKHNCSPFYRESIISTEAEHITDFLEDLRERYLETKDYRYWKELIRWLPESWLQTRTVTMNYENLYSMIRQRSHHKLTEWSVSFIGWCWTLPYAEELLFLDLDKKGES